MLPVDFEIIDFGAAEVGGHTLHTKRRAVGCAQPFAGTEFAGANESLPIFAPEEMVRRAANRLTQALDMQADYVGCLVVECPCNEVAPTGHKRRTRINRQYLGHPFDAHLGEFQVNHAASSRAEQFDPVERTEQRDFDSATIRLHHPKLQFAQSCRIGIAPR